jgi:hypothetical protein
MAKVDLTEYVIDQTMHCYISKEAVDKFSYDEIIESLKPKGNWSLTSFHSGSPEEVSLTYRNDDGIREGY